VKIKNTLAAIAALAIAASLFTTTSAFAAGTLDQVNLPDGDDSASKVTYINDATYLFTAALIGELDRVTLDLQKYGAPGTFFVEVFATNVGQKTGIALASESRSDSEAPNAMATVTIDFATPAIVEAGTTYALVLRAPNALGPDALYWGIGNGAQVYATYVTTAPSSSVESTSEVTAGVTAGSRTAGLTLAGFDAVAFSHSEQTTTTSTTLSVDDLTGANAGWNVTVSSSPLIWSAATDGPTAGSDLPASALAVTTVGSITTVSGDAWAGSTATGALDSPVKVLSTSGGNGSYTAPLTLTLTVPGQASVGTYAGTLTTTISAAP
jgi:hypothetical protein